jgi:cytochrome c oxidase assembly protein subunit 11
MRKPIAKSVLFSAIAAALMFGFSFAIAPLYYAYCKKTGINTAVRTNSIPDLSRMITIQFVATANQNLAWDFYPLTNSVSIHPNENTKVMFYAKNNTNHTMTVQAVPSFTPALSGKYFHKIECFCFTKQTLPAHGSRTMPVIFQVDDYLPENMNTITLAYSLFEIKLPPQRKGL